MLVSMLGPNAEQLAPDPFFCYCNAVGLSGHKHRYTGTTDPSEQPETAAEFTATPAIEVESAQRNDSAL